MAAQRVLGIGVVLLVALLSASFFTVGSEMAALPQLILPNGGELTDAELLQVSGDVVVLTVLAGAIFGAGTSAGMAALIDWADGNGISGWNVAYAALGGAVVGGAGAAFNAVALIESSLVLMKSTVVTMARWSARAAASAGAGMHSALHHGVRMPIQGAVSSVWNWMTGGR
ncbi:hypothetical protein ACFLTM_03865 [Candidatus Bipolaricaulota bacterium]